MRSRTLSAVNFAKSGLSSAISLPPRYLENRSVGNREVNKAREDENEEGGRKGYKVERSGSPTKSSAGKSVILLPLRARKLRFVSLLHSTELRDVKGLYLRCNCFRLASSRSSSGA